MKVFSFLFSERDVEQSAKCELHAYLKTGRHGDVGAHREWGWIISTVWNSVNFCDF